MEDEDNPLSAQEIDDMMSGLNFEYGRLKSPKEVRSALDETLKLIEKNPIYKSLTPENRQKLKEEALKIAKKEVEKAKIGISEKPK